MPELFELSEDFGFSFSLDFDSKADSSAAGDDGDESEYLDDFDDISECISLLDPSWDLGDTLSIDVFFD
jgi:hypothetical protein